MKLLEHAKCDWQDSQTPFSSSFDDVYFSKDDGVSESRYVFLEANQLAQRFTTLCQQHFIIGETGFGTGLNFLLAAQLFTETAAKGKQLYFISSEKYPLKKADLEQALSLWQESAFHQLSQQLLEQYPEAIAGQHLLSFHYQGFDIFLLLLFNDSLEGFNQLIENPHPIIHYAEDRAVDAWFLDGFAPSKNANMWQDALFHSIAKLSKRGTTVATFTAAGFVKRALQQAGFKPQKQKGFGKKREMLTAEFIGLPKLLEHINPTQRFKNQGVFWPIYRSRQIVEKHDKTAPVIIIGAGIAGCTTAKALAEAGVSVLLLDKNNEPMQEASGNPQAVLFPKLSPNSSVFSAFNYASFSYALRYYKKAAFANAFHKTGLIQLLPEKELTNSEKLQQLFKDAPTFLQLIDSKTATSIAGTSIQQSCLYYPQSGFIETEALKNAIIQHPNIRFQQADINSIHQQEHSWLATSANQQSYTGQAIILCSAEFSKALLDNKQLINTRNIRGQISYFNNEHLPTIKTVICHEGYITPCKDDNNKHYHCGASFEINDQNRKACDLSREKNLKQLAHFLPDFKQVNSDQTTPVDRVNFRCASNDYMPIVGPIADVDTFRENYAFMAKNARAHIPLTGSYQQGLFINIGYGSRGFSTAPLCAEIIKAYLLATPYPVSFDQIKALHPARFLINDIAKKTRKKHA